MIAGPPVSEFVRVYDSYAACYDPRTRTPKWVLEHITAKDLEGDANR
jgi:endonuclease G